MLKLSDFFHLPQLGAIVAELVADQPGLIVVSGLDPRPAAPAVRGQLLPSGRTAIFRALIGELMATTAAQAVVVTEDAAILRTPRSWRGRVTTLRVEPRRTYADQIAAAVARQPDLLVVDRLCATSAPAAAAAARRGVPVIAQLDSIFRGMAVVRQLHDLGVAAEHLSGAIWVVFVQRLPTLCQHCRQPAPAGAAQLERLQQLADRVGGDPADDNRRALAFFSAPGCDACGGSGRLGDVAAFDIFRRPPAPRGAEAPPSLLPLETYALRLAALGYLSLDDILHLDADQLGRTYRLLTSSEQALAEANATLERKLVELNAANEVLQQRTAALLSLQEIGQALITSSALQDLVGRVCHHARELCGADRAILYLLREGQRAEVLAVNGWEAALVHQQIDAAMVACDPADGEPQRFRDWPPGVPPRHPDVEGAVLRAGLRVPLVAEGQQVGLMIVHTTHKARFAPGEVALLRTFANQAALSIQRAALIDRLRANIAQLEAAQAALVRQERMEREIELARQVQQSVLPRVFPDVPGYTFAACNRPARLVGGDFYDVFTLDEEHIGIVIADVSDKGMPAALYMALTRSLLFAEARRARSPRAVLLNVNRLLRELGEPHMFVTVFYGVIALRERRLVYARAGHDYPLLFRDGTVQSLEGTGVVLGPLDQVELHLSEEQIDLVHGDRLVLYTDGLMDALNPQGRRFGLEQLTALLQVHAQAPAAELCDAAFAALGAYQGDAEQYDDMTILAVAVG